MPVLNLVFTDEALHQFDSNFKVQPPLREESDRQALLRALADGTIDFIYANHVPLDTEAKDLEFPYAEFGAIGLETAFALCRTYLADALPLDQLVRLLSINPRRVLGLDPAVIEDGAPANLTLFHPDKEWVYDERSIHSKSRNSPLIGQTLKGKPMGVVRGSQIRTFFQ